ncbi:anthranilate synthase component 1 [Shewanella oneidensis]|uniref:Anthranilate synthase component 1 n=1 Tax=Shewanella oneidensis (strain ATCC 700550 / JCM 31522 / CIP 106686 / LMG 19005 / NCIMB 14063 / MR-1) TaxID=211586 RepID=Q8ECV4_SHEON|nr:anthranilate synthase component 1 [Shewanella oneidensis]AAN56031.1 anthranilate synthase component I TrpE [Shewanella oneidensis MR-1]MDX5999533.1 anthranilate synthase component 1 [Shewanella oneidensis]MEE2027398.1 Anthranilate synthase component 1 [Shewanella oneidensis]
MTLKTFNQVTQADRANLASSQQTFARSHTLKATLVYHSDPLRLYQHITEDAPHTMLLESAEINSKENLKSMVMTHAALMIRCDGYRLRFSALTDNGASLLTPIEQFFMARSCHTQCQRNGQHLVVTLQKDTELKDEDARLKSTSPLDGLRLFVKHIDCGAHTDSQSKPAFEDLFLGGVLSYDLIDTVEPLPEAPNGANDCPDYLFYLAETLILIDHKQKQAEIITHNFSESAEQHSEVTQALAERVENIRAQCEALAKSATPAPALVGITATEQVNVSDEAFKQTVIDLKEHIIAGDIFQVVPSRSFSLPCPNTLGAYRALRLTNPSPYMFYFRGNDFTLFGASPESALKFDSSNNQVEVYPIAGTRKRGKTASGEIDFDLDSRIELELRLDKKELSEHLMLVDLARNDIARISQSGSRKVAELLKVDRYSHVMHLVSRVTGQLRQDLDALHAYQACMNMGTLVGAPKVRASQLVRQAEKTRRGSYGGAVGYLNALGDMDTCIVIRSAFVKDGVAHIQAGAGVVFDSDPQSEADETRQKAQAVISAIKMGAGLAGINNCNEHTSTKVSTAAQQG